MVGCSKTESNRLSFFKSLVNELTKQREGGDNDVTDNLKFLIDRYDDVERFLNSKSLMTKNRYATHILNVFKCTQDKNDSVVFETCRNKYRGIVSDTKKQIRDQKTRNKQVSDEPTR